MKKISRLWLEMPETPTYDIAMLEYGYDSEQVRYRTYGESSSFLFRRASMQDTMESLFTLPVSLGDDLRDAGLGLLKASIVDMVNTELDHSLASAVKDWLDLCTYDDAECVAGLVDLLVVGKPNYIAIRAYMRDNL